MVAVTSSMVAVAYLERACLLHPSMVSFETPVERPGSHPSKRHDVRDDGRSLTGILCTTRGFVGVLASQEIVGFELHVPISRSCLEIAPAKPNIMAGGYLLKSDAFMSSGSTWPAWLHLSPSQQQMSKSVERVVALATN